MASDKASPVLCRSAELTWRMTSRRYVVARCPLRHMP